MQVNATKKNAILLVMVIVSVFHELELFSKKAQLGYDTPRKDPVKTRSRPLKIAVLSSYIASNMWSSSSEKMKEQLDYLVNKACYANLWGYDFVFNVTKGEFGATETSRHDQHWLSYGAWHRAPQLRDMIERYDWILYTDIDFAIRDVTMPVEAIIHELELSNMSASVVVPADAPSESRFDFSSFALLIKNSPFGISVLDHWIEMGKGLCPKGNFRNSEPGKYHWRDSDQPGLWYGLIKAYMKFHPSDTDPPFPVCSNETGFVENGDGAFQDVINRFFQGKNVKLGTTGNFLEKIPKSQPILWSTFDPRSPGQTLGLQGNFPKSKPGHSHALGIHKKNPKSTNIQIFDHCQRNLGCYANASGTGGLQIGCNGVEYFRDQLVSADN